MADRTMTASEQAVRNATNSLHDLVLVALSRRRPEKTLAQYRGALVAIDRLTTAIKVEIRRLEAADMQVERIIQLGRAGLNPRVVDGVLRYDGDDAPTGSNHANPDGGNNGKTS